MPGLVEQLRSVVDQTYVVAFSARCGSTLVTADLARAQVGRPTEYFQAKEVDASGKSVAEYVLRTVSVASVDGLFGCKVSWEQGASLLRRLADEGAVARGTTLDELFPNVQFLHLTRTDVLSQAVSWWRARVTGEWHRLAGSDGPVPPVPPFDVAAAANRYLQISAETNLWNEWFRRRQVEPYRLVYEQWCEDRAAGVASVAAFLGVVPPSPVPVPEDLQVLRDEWSTMARERLWNYLAEPADPYWVGLARGE